MKYIPLNHGKQAVVDDEDYDELIKHNWTLNNHPTQGYAFRNIYVNSKLTKSMRMHRQIMDAPPHLQVDHINGDKLDNRRSNLRLCKNRQNARNRGKQKNNTTGFKGVYRNSKLPHLYEAKIGVGGKTIYLGLYKSKLEAYVAYVEAAKLYHREFAHV